MTPPQDLKATPVPEPDFTFHLEPYLIMLFVAAAMISVSNFFLGPWIMPQSLNCSFERCIVSVTSAIIGIALFLGSFNGIFKGLKRAGYIYPGKHPPHPVLGSGPEEERILIVANEVLGKFKRRRRRHVEAVSWSELEPWHSCQLTSFRVKPTGIILPDSLHGRLDDGDWKMLIDLNFRMPPIKLFAKFMLTMMGPFLLFLPPVFVINSVYGLQTELVFSRSVGPFIGLLMVILVFVGTRRLFLRRDLALAASIGRTPLLSLFQKIESLGLPEIEKAKTREGWLARLWPMPTITDRIKNLQAQF